jgi:hypothetical protein
MLVVGVLRHIKAVDRLDLSSATTRTVVYGQLRYWHNVMVVDGPSIDATPKEERQRIMLVAGSR